MSKMRKLLAILLTFAMVLGMSITTMAADLVGEYPSASDKAEIKVTGLPDEATVNAYQVVEAEYFKDTDAEQGFKQYVVVDGVVIADPLKPTVDEIANIANAVPATLKKVTLEGNGTDGYTAQVEAGYWLIIVDPIDTKVYNPMLAGVYYENKTGEDNTIEGGTVNSKDNWVLNGTIAHVKSSDTILNKEIVDPSTGNNKADDAAIGADLTFKVTSKIPAYSEATYKNAVFTITDTLSEGLDFVSADTEVVVKVDDSVVKNPEGKYTVTINGKVLTVNFESDYIFKNGGKNVEITYVAELNDKAALDNVGNSNEVLLKYSNKPGSTEDAEVKKTYHYTFDFTAKKVDEKNAVLKDAIFELKDANGNVVATATSGEDGILSFTGLDRGTYTLVETQAPEGYQLDETIHQVVIDAKYNADGTMKEYSITIDNKAVEDWDIETKQLVTGEMTFMNTKLVALPSTGGIGTTMFTIGGCGIMIAAAYLFFASRRKEEA